MSKDAGPSKLPETVLDFVVSERQFIHDLANPLAISWGMLEAYRAEVKRTGIEQSESLTRKLDKIEVALARIGKIMQGHREHLILIHEANDPRLKSDQDSGS